MRRIQVRWEFVLADMWIGVYWRVTRWADGKWHSTDVWACPFFCIPIHITVRCKGLCRVA